MEGMEGMEKRLLELERHVAAQDRRLIGLGCRVKRYRQALLAVVLVLVGVALVGATGDKDAEFRTIKAQRVFIVNATGMPMGAFSSDEHGGAVALYSSTQQPVVGFSTTEKGGAMALYSHTGQGAVLAEIDKEGSGYVSAANRKGYSRTLKP